MSRAIRTLTEAQIRAAQAKGELTGLAGEGKPLPDRSALAHLDAGEQVAHRIMAEAGVLPREITLKKQLDTARTELAALTDAEARKEKMREVALLEMKYNVAIEARRRVFR